jgi:translation initiation factor 2B subunit (eIF-2B alpha/beta/delta family)
VELAAKMESAVKDLWKQSPEPPTFTPHGPSHFGHVENWVRQLIPEPKWHELSPEERKILTWSSWTHDIGMLLATHPVATPDAIIRNEHVEVSAKWVCDNYEVIGLTELEAQVIADVNRYHSRKNDIDSCPERRLFNGQYVRTRLLAAYLRLADALEVSRERVGEDLHHRFGLLVHQMSQENDSTLFHWIKSFVVSGIAVRHESQEIRVEFMRAEGFDDGKYEFVKRYVLNEIEDELASVERVLAEGGLSSFLTVSADEVWLVHGRVQEQLKNAIQRVLDYVKMAQSPTSTAVTRAALDATEALLEKSTIRNDGRGRSLSFVDGMELLERSLKHQLKVRKCHNELRRLYEFIHDLLEQDGIGYEKYDPLAADLLKAYVVRFKALVGRDAARERLQVDNFQSALQSIVDSHSEGAPWTFLLYGCSETVAISLRELERNHEVRVWIAEGRPKTRHGAHNAPTYVDAETYVAQLRSAGFRGHHIYVIPDATIATAFDRSRNGAGPLGSIHAVIIGTNGIYVEPEISVAHAAGHLGVAIVAKAFNVPVIVLGSSAKIAKRSNREREASSRGDQWLPTSAEAIRRLRKEKCNIEWNPREDHIPFNLLAAIVTEDGIVAQTTGVEEAKRALSTWMASVDAYLAGPQ